MVAPSSSKISLMKGVHDIRVTRTVRKRKGNVQVTVINKRDCNGEVSKTKEQKSTVVVSDSFGRGKSLAKPLKLFETRSSIP